MPTTLPAVFARKISGLHDRRLTGEVLADVDRRVPVDEVLSLQERDVLARAEGDDRIRIERGESGARDLGVRPADDGQLAGRGEVEIKRVQSVAKRRRRLRQEAGDEAENTDRPALELWIAPEPRESQEHVREHRVPRRCRVVVEIR